MGGDLGYDVSMDDGRLDRSRSEVMWTLVGTGHLPFLTSTHLGVFLSSALNTHRGYNCIRAIIFHNNPCCSMKDMINTPARRTIRL